MTQSTRRVRSSTAYLLIGVAGMLAVARGAEACKGNCCSSCHTSSGCVNVAGGNSFRSCIVCLAAYCGRKCTDQASNANCWCDRTILGCR